MEVLKDTSNKVNKKIPKKISRARLIKALILFSREMEGNGRRKNSESLEIDMVNIVVYILYYEVV